MQRVLDAFLSVAHRTVDRPLRPGFPRVPSIIPCLALKGAALDMRGLEQELVISPKLIWAGRAPRTQATRLRINGRGSSPA